MMAKDPDDRYQQPAEVAAALAPSTRAAAQSTRETVTPQSRPVPARRRRRPIVLALLAAALTLFLGAVFYVNLGETTVKFEVNDPSLAVKFGEGEITIDNDGQPIRITPGRKHSFTISHNGVEALATSFTLRKGEDVVLAVSIEEGRIAVVPRGDDAQLDFGRDGDIRRESARPQGVFEHEQQILEAVATFQGEHADDKHSIMAMTLSADRRTIATRHTTGVVAVWDVPQRRERASWKLDPTRGRRLGLSGGIALSAEGAWLAVAGDRSVSLHKALTGRLAHQFETPPGLSLSVSFSPDGRILAGGSVGGDPFGEEFGRRFFLKLWGGGKEPVEFELPDILAAAPEDERRIIVRDMAFSPDGKHFIVAGSVQRVVRPNEAGKGWLIAWDTSTRRVLRRLPDSDPPATDVAFTADGQYLLTCHGGGLEEQSLFRVRRVGTGEVVRTFGGKAERIGSLDVSPDDRFAVTVSHQGAARLWRIATGEELAHFKPPSRRRLRQSDERLSFPVGAAFLDDSSFVIANTDSLAVWRLREESPATEASKKPHAPILVPTADVPTLEPKETLRGERSGGVDLLGGGVTGFAITADRRTAFVGHAGGGVAVVDLSEKRQIASLKMGVAAPTLAASADGRWVAAGNSQGNIRIWSVAEQEPVLTVEEYDGNIRSLALSADGQVLISGAMQNPGSRKGERRFTPAEPLAVWKVGKPDAAAIAELPATVQRPPENIRIDVDAVRYSPTGRFLAVAGNNWRYGEKDELAEIEDFLYLWDLKASRSPRRLERVKTHATTLAFTPDEIRFITGHAGDDVESCVLRIWDIDSGRVVAEMRGHAAPIISVDVSPDGKLAASVDSGGEVRVWRFADMREIARLASQDPSRRERSHAAFLADSRTLLTAGAEGVKLWSLPEEGTEESQAKSDDAKLSALDELVQLAEVNLARMEQLFLAGVASSTSVLDAKVELLEAKMRRAEKQGDQAELVNVLERLVAIREEHVVRIRDAVQQGAASQIAHHQAQKALLEAKLRLSEERSRLKAND
ncbi:MAG: hypothetical protein KY475_13885 [Planctomycetes bacterium]|nr:hypothetical protein [Planctomycetota bacterium]